MFIIIVFGILFFFIAQNGKNIKAKNILKDLGYNNISDITVYSINQFENIDTRVQGNKYSIKFKNGDTNEICKGFIIKDYKHNIDKDLLCKKDN